MDLSKIYPDLNFASYLEDDEDCYVSYDIRRTPSAYSSYEDYGVYLLNEEIINYNNQYYRIQLRKNLFFYHKEKN